MDRYICIHGHFYQPPRENPWLEAIELQDSAYPYHDWNERITQECYAPNMASRILDSEGRILEIVNNYSKISFNIGPTLLSWMQDKSPATYAAILDADKESRKNFSGHGSALAQVYNHMILPLSNTRDKQTQVKWGLVDFKTRFGRDPEGMWLPETAVNTDTLEVLAEHGIKFTVLSPHQALRYRKIGLKTWRDATDGSIDPTTPYRVTLPSGREITVFFYDGPVSRAVAFEKLLGSGEVFANRIIGSFSNQRPFTQLAHIATDGETYGHHHRHGEMALSYALHYIESQKLARLTNYGEFLEKFPPAHEAEIVENSAWSCAHGVDRWKANCGCNVGSALSWTQEWRRPLRDALDWLRDTLAGPFEDRARQFFNDPWKARDEYISVILNRTPETLDAYFSSQGSRELSADERIAALKLMELQRQAMLMYTSCGWFFDDLSNIETVQVIAYAGRALQLAEELFGSDLEQEFLNRLEQAHSNIPLHGDGRQIFERFVRPAMVDLQKVAAHYALSSLFEPYDEKVQIYCYTFEREDYKLIPEGKSRLALGRVKVRSEVTGESKQVVFCALHLGDHNLSGGTMDYTGEEDYHRLVEEMSEVFAQSDLPAFFKLIDKNFSSGLYTLKALFHDEKRRILDVVLDATIVEAESAYQHIYEHHAPLMRFLSDLNMPLPKPFATAALFAINTSLRRALEASTPDFSLIKALLDEARRARVKLDDEGLNFALSRALERIAERFRKNPDDVAQLLLLEQMAGLAHSAPLHADFWKIQNIFYEMLHEKYPEMKQNAEKGDAQAQSWTRHFTALGNRLKVRV